MGLLTLPAIELVLYIVLRYTGTFWFEYHQGSWDLCSSAPPVMEVFCAPMGYAEESLRNYLRCAKEPTGP